MQHDTHQQREELLPPFAAQVQAREDKTKRKLPLLQFCFFSNVTTYWTLTVKQFNHEAPDYNLHLFVWYWCTSSMKKCSSLGKCILSHTSRGSTNYSELDHLMFEFRYVPFGVHCSPGTCTRLLLFSSTLTCTQSCKLKRKQTKKKRENQHLEDAVLLAFLGHMALTDKVKSMRK